MAKEDKKTITVQVNEKPVAFDQNRATGLAIKTAAINQGVIIEEDFNLFEVKPDETLKLIGNDDEVTLNKNKKFRAVAPDDNSNL